MRKINKKKQLIYTYIEENIKEIMQNKNISNGMLIFINDGQNNNELLEKIKNTLQLKNTTYLKRLNACDVYLIK